VFLIAVIVLLASSILLIANTIRLSIFSRRREIEVMKLVGATNWFVRGPFMLEGLFCGLAGSILAATTSTLAALAIRTGAPVIPLFAFPLPGGRYHCYAGRSGPRPDPGRDVRGHGRLPGDAQRTRDPGLGQGQAFRLRHLAVARRAVRREPGPGDPPGDPDRAIRAWRSSSRAAAPTFWSPSTAAPPAWRRWRKPPACAFMSSPRPGWFASMRASASAGPVAGLYQTGKAKPLGALGRIEDLATQRDSLVGQAEQVRNAITGVHLDL